MELTNGVTVVVGPTAVGKTEYAHNLARLYSAPIVSADSRQVYSGMSVGTAAPSPRLRREVEYHFVQTISPGVVYSAREFADEALRLIGRWMAEGREHVLVVGGSMLYVRALLYEMDPIPQLSPTVRTEVRQLYEKNGLEAIRQELLRVDPDYLEKVDPNNYRRLLRALEVFRGTGRAFSSFHTGRLRHFNFPLRLVVLERERSLLYDRIDSRVDEMMNEGLLDEVRALRPYRSTSALQTIGYRECFSYLDGAIDLEECKRLIRKNTRTLARQQDRFFRKLPGAELVEI